MQSFTSLLPTRAPHIIFSLCLFSLVLFIFSLQRELEDSISLLLPPSSAYFLFFFFFMMMKAFMVANMISFLTLLCFLAIINYLMTSITSLTTILLLILFPLFPTLLNLCITIPAGGFAWRNVHNYNQSTKNDLRGPISWPFLGLLPQMASDHPHRKLASLANSLGANRLMAFSLGTSTRVVISSHPDTAKEILSGSSFGDRPIRESARLLMFERAIGFAPSSTGYWRHLRRIAANHMFSPRRVSSMEGVRQNLAEDMMEKVMMEMEEKGEVEFRRIIKKGSLDNVLETVFGSRSSSLRGGEELGLMVREGYELMSEFNWTDYVPLVGYLLDFSGVKKRCHKLAGKVSFLIGQIINERKRDADVSMKNDFLSVWLSLPVEDRITDADLIAVLWEMVFRGTDTVAILLEWIMARMVIHQDVQQKAQQEIDRVVGLNRPVQDSDISNLPYLQSIVKEVLRLHPPGPLLSWARLAIQDVHINKVLVPAGTTAMVNMWAITHDPKIWNDPWTFQPERFIGNDISVMGSDLRLAPFGSGRRVCPGRTLGLATVYLWLGRFLQQYKWVPCRQPVDLSECLKLSLEMKKPLVCCAVNRHNCRI